MYKTTSGTVLFTFNHLISCIYPLILVLNLQCLIVERDIAKILQFVAGPPQSAYPSFTYTHKIQHKS